MAVIDLKEAIKTYFGFDAFKGEQEAIIHNVLDGNNTFVIMPTGGGKSMCYQLPALISEGTAIVVDLKNQVDSIRNVRNDNCTFFKLVIEQNGSKSRKRGYKSW